MPGTGETAGPRGTRENLGKKLRPSETISPHRCFTSCPDREVGISLPASPSRPMVSETSTIDASLVKSLTKNNRPSIDANRSSISVGTTGTHELASFDVVKTSALGPFPIDRSWPDIVSTPPGRWRKWSVRSWDAPPRDDAGRVLLVLDPFQPNATASALSI
jgi:hypothetical protein